MAIVKQCEVCGTSYSVPNYRREKSRFCGTSCRSSWVAKNHLNKGPKPWASANLDGHRHKSSSRFSEGNLPWNKGVKGIHLSPETEFKPDRKSEKSLPFASVTIRHDRNGKPRAWVKTQNGWRPRAQIVYVAKNGEIPCGKVVHHIDGDSLNDRPKNLIALTPAEHIEAHRSDLCEARNA